MALAENNPYMASSRSLYIQPDLEMEKGWNYGINLSRYLHLGLRELTLNASYYHTRIDIQLVTDLDQSAGEVHFYNLEGRTYSKVFHAVSPLEALRGLDVVAAWRIN